MEKKIYPIKLSYSTIPSGYISLLKESCTSEIPYEDYVIFYFDLTKRMIEIPIYNLTFARLIQRIIENKSYTEIQIALPNIED